MTLSSSGVSGRTSPDQSNGFKKTGERSSLPYCSAFP